MSSDVTKQISEENESSSVSNTDETLPQEVCDDEETKISNNKLKLKRSDEDNEESSIKKQCTSSYIDATPVMKYFCITLF